MGRAIPPQGPAGPRPAGQAATLDPCCDRGAVKAQNTPRDLFRVADAARALFVQVWQAYKYKVSLVITTGLSPRGNEKFRMLDESPPCKGASLMLLLVRKHPTWRRL